MMVNLRIGDDDLLSIVDNDCTEDRITELDVSDPEKAEWSVWVRCEHCDDGGEVMDMVRQWDGAWLCPWCDAGAQAEYDDWLRTARGW